MNVKEALCVKENKKGSSNRELADMNKVIRELRIAGNIKETEISFNDFSRSAPLLKIYEIDGDKFYFINGKFKTFNQFRAYVNKYHFVDHKGICGEVLIEAELV